MTKLFKTVLIGALVGVLAVAHGATDTTAFDVKIVITESCDIDTTAATDVDFGSKTAFETVGEAMGTLTVKCTNGTDYAITLDDGDHALTPGNRRMSDGTNFIPYGLYQTTGTSTPWTSVSGIGNGSNQTLNVYGTVAPGANNVPAGSYTDEVIATVTY